MNYEEKFYENFGKNDFTFIDVVRDNVKKRTFLKIKCNTCEQDEMKEQFDLFTKDKVFCHNCNNRKKTNKLNVDDEILNIQNKFDIIVTKSEKINNEIFIFFNCKSCGDEAKNSIYEYTRKDNQIKFVGYCRKCSQNKRKWKNQHKTDKVKEWFINKGIEPLFEEYINSYTFLDLKCKCGNTFKMTFKNRFHHDENWTPACQDCKDLERLSKYNYTYNRYDTRKKDGVWSKQIKKKFNNKCAITGDTEKIISHHLNGYNSYPEQKYDINNGVVINEQLHNEFHLIYDKYKGNCTLQQFEEFFEMKTNKKFNIENYENKKH